ncbi:MAG: hypothetical protein KC505_08565, partial [Myxococcales bacterium]|nr:hypothetical protein [Myxococcales bacterium]
MTQQLLTTRTLMNRIYKDLCGFEIPSEDNQRVKKSKGSPVYGEIRHAALNKLLAFLKLDKKDVFYDLGSGVGKVVIHTALTTLVKKSVGVELSLLRYKEASVAFGRACEYEPLLKSKITLLHKDLMSVDLSEATVIYVCSTAFSIKFMKEVSKRLAQFTHPFRLVSLQELPDEKHFRLLKILRLDMSWMRSTPVHIYERRSA